MPKEHPNAPPPAPKGDIDDLIFRLERPSQPSQR